MNILKLICIIKILLKHKFNFIQVSLKNFSLFNYSCIYTGNTFIYATMIPMVLPMLLNIILFIPIVKEIQRHISMQGKFQKKRQLMTRFVMTFSCSLLLGLTWTFGLFSLISDLRAPFQWLFCIFNSLQGFFIFIFNVVRNKDAKELWIKTLTFNSKRNRAHTTSKDSIIYKLKTRNQSSSTSQT